MLLPDERKKVVFVLFRSQYNTLLSALVKGKFSMPFALAFIYFVVNTRKRKKKKKKKRRDVHVSRSPGAYLPFCIMTYQ